MSVTAFCFHCSGTQPTITATGRNIAAEANLSMQVSWIPSRDKKVGHFVEMNKYPILVIGNSQKT